jgi:hypothetical protein
MMALLVVSAFGSTHLSAQAVTPQEDTSEAVVIPEPVLELSAALKMREVMQVLREEGLASGAELANDLPRGATDPLWSAALSRIYDPAQMEAASTSPLPEALPMRARQWRPQPPFLPRPSVSGPYRWNWPPAELCKTKRWRLWRSAPMPIWPKKTPNGRR